MGLFSFNTPAVIVTVISVVIGFVMVFIFAWTSDQKAIGVAKEHLKAHLLALRLFQDQIPVVMKSYGRIVVSTGRYLKLAFKPLLFVIIPLTLLAVYADRYLGSEPIARGQAFLVKARITNPDALNSAALQLPDGVTATSPAVHVPATGEVAWRLTAEKDGKYDVKLRAGDQTVGKELVVATGMPRLSSVRLRDRFWERIFVSGEPALPSNSPIDSIEVQYPARDIAFAGYGWNWIWLFFVLSLAAGFLFKSIFGIEI